MYYTLNSNNQIEMSANFKFSDKCLYTDKNIVRGFDGVLRFEDETKTSEYLANKNNYETIQNNQQLIAEKQARLTELTKDFAQVNAGLVIDNLEERKAEFRTLLNEVRELQGKEPRKTNN